MNVLLSLCLLLTPLVVASSCDGGAPTAGIWTEEPVLVNQTQNGKLYTVGGDDNPLQIIHLYGTPYQMGQAQGLLLKDRILEMFQMFYPYIASQAPFLKYIPEFLRKIIVQDGIDAALDYEILLTRKYVPDYFTEEAQGLADALGLSFDYIMRIAMFPELIKASCSIVGAWGEATETGTLYHLRALDWGTENPFRIFPTFFVYHPEEGNGHPFAALGWNGLLGAITGYSPYVGAGEKVWLKYNGTDIREGIPWNFLFRDILQYDMNVSIALERIETAERTCSIFLGLGDHTSDFKIVEYSHDRVEVFGDDTPFPGYVPSPPEHPMMEGVVYADKHSQPSTDPCLGDLLQSYHGKIGAQALINVTSFLQTGDMHAAVWDYSKNLAYIALASQNIPYPPPDPNDVIPAYSRQYIQLDMNALFSLTN